MKKLNNLLKIGWFLPSLFVLFIILPLLILGSISYYVSSNSITNKLEMSMEQSIKQSKSAFEDTFQSIESTMNMIVSNNIVLNSSADGKNNNEIAYLLESAARYSSKIQNIYYIPLKGDGVSVNNPSVLADGVQKQDWYKNALEGKTRFVWLEPHPSIFTDDIVLTAVKEVMNKDGETIGVIGMDMEVYQISEDTFDIAIGDTGYLMLLTKDGTILSHPDFNQLGEKFDNQTILKKLNSNEIGSLNYNDANNKPIFIKYETFSKMNLKFVSVMPMKELKSDSYSLLKITIIIAVICIVIGGLLAFLASRRISKPIEELMTLMTRLENGDMTVRSTTKTRIVETRNLSDKFNKMVERFSNLIKSSKETSQILKISTLDLETKSNTTKEIVSQVAVAIEEIAEGSASQAEETGKGLDMSKALSTEIEAVKKSNDKLIQSANSAGILSEEGSKTIHQLRDKSQESSAILKNVTKSIQELSESTKEIHSIIQSITDIAGQTNLLALNASIEAARAGEHGKGFSVVAVEVRKLAEQSATAAQNITSIIKSINERTISTVNKTEEAMKIFQVQDHMVDSTMSSFATINQSIANTISQVDEVHISIQNMIATKDMILDAYEKISVVTEQTAASSEEVSQSAQNEITIIEEMNNAIIQLSQLSEELTESIEVFTLEKEN
jgi:methyl-accepting chemotaxis protein